MGRMGRGYKAEAKKDMFGKGSSGQPKSGREAREAMGEGVLKTVRVEARYSP